MIAEYLKYLVAIVLLTMFGFVTDALLLINPRFWLFVIISVLVLILLTLVDILKELERKR